MKPIDDSRTDAMKVALFQSFKLGAKYLYSNSLKLKEGVRSSLPSLRNGDYLKLAEKEDCSALEFDLEDDDLDVSDDSFSDSSVEYGFHVVSEKEQQNTPVSGAATTTIQQEEINGKELTSQTSLGESSSEGENNEISKETLVRVENLPLTMSINELAILFHKAGVVKEIEIRYADPLPGASRGFCIVTMGTAEEADKAVDMYNGLYLQGNAIIVKRTELRLHEMSEMVCENDEISEETQVCVGNLPRTVNSLELMELFHRAGVVKKSEITYGDDSLLGGCRTSRGFGIVTMSSIEEAEKAVHLFNGSYLENTAITVNRLGQETYYICVDNLSHKVDDERLEGLFNNRGFKVVSAQIVTDRYTKRSRGFGLVEMISVVERKDAITTLDRMIVDGKVIRLTPLGKELNQGVKIKKITRNKRCPPQYPTTHMRMC